MRKAKFNRPITVALEEQLFIKIQNISDSEGISIAKVIRDVLGYELLKEGNVSSASQPFYWKGDTPMD